MQYKNNKKLVKKYSIKKINEPNDATADQILLSNNVCTQQRCNQNGSDMFLLIMILLLLSNGWLSVPICKEVTQGSRTLSFKKKKKV